MQIHTATVSSQGQLTVPIDIRRQLGLTAGSVVVWEVKPNVTGLPQVTVRAGTSQALRELRGVGKNLYKKHGGAQKVLEQERQSWEQ